MPISGAFRFAEARYVYDAFMMIATDVLIFATYKIKHCVAFCALTCRTYGAYCSFLLPMPTNSSPLWGFLQQLRNKDCTS
jgi:hypothetical protein